MNRKVTDTGLGYYKFLDSSGIKCSIQKSSASEPRIWFGVDDPKPRISVKEAKLIGVDTKGFDEDELFVSYDVPGEVLMSTRMHLNVEQAESLIKVLKKFVKKGDI